MCLMGNPEKTAGHRDCASHAPLSGPTSKEMGRGEEGRGTEGKLGEGNGVECVVGISSYFRHWMQRRLSTDCWLRRCSR